MSKSRNRGFYKQLTEEDVLALPKAQFSFRKLSKPEDGIIYRAKMYLSKLVLEFNFRKSDLENMDSYYQLGLNFPKKFTLELHYEATKGFSRSPGKPWDGKEYYVVKAFINPRNISFLSSWINEQGTKNWIKQVPSVDSQFIFRN